MAPATPSGTLKLLKYWMMLSPETKHHIGLRANHVFAEHFDMRRNASALLELLRPNPAPNPKPNPRRPICP